MTTRFSVRPVAITDVDAILMFERANRAFFERWVPPRPTSYFDHDALRAALRDLIDDKDGWYGLIMQADGIVIGRINLSFVRRNRTLVVEVGYRVGQDSEGRGAASFAVRSAVEWASAQGRFGAMEAYALRENAASVRVLEKAGFEPVMGMRRSDVLNGRPVDLQLHRRRLQGRLACP